MVSLHDLRAVAHYGPWTKTIEFVRKPAIGGSRPVSMLLSGPP